MRFASVLIAALLWLSSITFVQAARQDSTPTATQTQAADASAAKKSKAKSRPAGKVEYMRAVPSK